MFSKHERLSHRKIRKAFLKLLETKAKSWKSTTWNEVEYSKHVFRSSCYEKIDDSSTEESKSQISSKRSKNQRRRNNSKRRRASNSRTKIGKTLLFNCLVENQYVDDLKELTPDYWEAQIRKICQVNFKEYLFTGQIHFENLIFLAKERKSNQKILASYLCVLKSNNANDLKQVFPVIKKLIGKNDT